MKKPRIITGLDIGSSKVSGVTAEIDKDGLFEITAEASFPSKGISRGVVVDLNEAADSVSKVLRTLSDKASTRPENIYVNISGESIKGEKSKGMIPLSLRGREVTKADIDKCVNVATTIRLQFDMDIIHKIVHNFSIDDQPWIRNPLGLYASRLACEVYVITASVNHIQNIYKCVNNAGYDVKKAVSSGMADGCAVLDEREKEEGVMLLDIGASLTEASLFSGGVLREMAVLPVGTADLRSALKDSHEFNSIISRVKSMIEEFLKKGGAIVSVKLIGGIVFTDDIVEFLEEKLSLPVKIGAIKGARGNISSPESMKVVTAVGLARYACEKIEKKALESKDPVRRLSTKVIEIFNNYF